MSENTTEKRRGQMLFYGLRNGTTIGMLTEKEVEAHNGWLVITTTEGENVTIRLDDVVYTRSREVDVPSDEEVADFLKSLVGSKLSGLAPSSDVPTQTAGLGGHYL